MLAGFVFWYRMQVGLPCCSGVNGPKSGPKLPKLVCAGWSVRAIGGSEQSSYANSLNGLKTLRPGRLKSRSLPVAMVSPWRRAVAAM